jgi:hypothetical protein
VRPLLRFTGMIAAVNLSDFEKARAANILRNKAFIESLGFEQQTTTSKPVNRTLKRFFTANPVAAATRSSHRIRKKVAVNSKALSTDEVLSNSTLANPHDINKEQLRDLIRAESPDHHDLIITDKVSGSWMSMECRAGPPRRH